MSACTPGEGEFQAYRGPERFAALSICLLADSETPISVYRRLARGKRDAVLLESVEGGELMGRYSFIVAGVDERLTFRDDGGLLERWEPSRDRAGGWTSEEIHPRDPLAYLRERLKDWTVWSPVPLPRFHGGAVGYLGFDCIRHFEDLPLAQGPGLGHPEARFLFARDLYIYDHVSRRLTLVTHVALEGDRSAAYAEGRARLDRAMARLYEEPLAPGSPWALGADQLAQASVPDERRPPRRTNRTRVDFEDAVRRARRHGDRMAARVLTRAEQQRTEATHLARRRDYPAATRMARQAERTADTASDHAVATARRPGRNGRRVASAR